MALDKFCPREGLGWGQGRAVWSLGRPQGPQGGACEGKPRGYIRTVDSHSVFKRHMKASDHLFGGGWKEEGGEVRGGESRD